MRQTITRANANADANGRQNDVVDDDEDDAALVRDVFSILPNSNSININIIFACVTQKGYCYCVWRTSRKYIRAVLLVHIKPFKSRERARRQS